MKALRYLLLTLILMSLVGLFVTVSQSGVRTPVGRTFAPLFSFLGRGTKSADRMVSRMVPADQIDEKTFGDTLKEQMRERYGKNSVTAADAAYVNQLLKEMTSKMEVHFEYEAFIIPGPPNAAALPGGVILVTNELMNTLTTEAQLVSILGHEIGHIERGHCFDSVKFQLVANKYRGYRLGQITDFLYGTLIHHTFSKTQEQESDDYAFDTISLLGYLPSEMSVAFENLEKSEHQTFPEGPNPFRDYFSSHPSILLRIENSREKAKRFLAQGDHVGDTFYVGRRNFVEKKSRGEIQYPEEMGGTPF